MNVGTANLLGSVTALYMMTMLILIFTCRLARKNKAENELGIAFMVSAVPLLYLLYTAGRFQRPVIYSVQIICMLIFIGLELVLDYVLKIDFRRMSGLRAVYVIFFFAGTGGLIGIASHAGAFYTLTSVALFWITAILSIYQHKKTGM